MNKAELDNLTARVISLLKERGVFISGSGSAERTDSFDERPRVAPEGRSPFKMDPMLIPVVITGRTVSLCREDREKLFGSASLTKDENLSKGRRVVYQETVTVIGPGGDIKDVHILASEDNKSQVELLSGDNSLLGINAPLRLTGDTECSAPCRIAGPSGSIELEEGAIIPLRRITLDPEHAKHFGVIPGQVVSVTVSGSRGGVLTNCAVIIEEGVDSVCFLDVNEADAMCVSDGAMVRISK